MHLVVVPLLWQSLEVFHDLDLLMNSSWAFCRMSLNLGLFDVFLGLDQGCAFGARRPDRRCHTLRASHRGLHDSVCLIPRDVDLDQQSLCPRTPGFKCFPCAKRGGKIKTQNAQRDTSAGPVCLLG